MPLFLIRRTFTNASETDLDAAAFRALACAPYHEGMRWERSYWDASAEETLCIYLAKGEVDIRSHAQRAHIPCDEVRQIDEVLPERYGGASAFYRQSEEVGTPMMFVVRRPFPGATTAELDAAAIRSLACAQPGLSWVRSFWDARMEETLCVYNALSADDIRHHAIQAQIPCDEVRSVEEILPERFINA